MNEFELFQSALDIDDPAARKLFLKSACEQNAEMLSRVESLLASHEGESRFLQSPVVEQLGDDPAGQTAATLVMGTGSTHDESPGGEAASILDFSQLQERTRMSDEIPLGYLEPSTKPGSLGRLAHYEILEVIGQGAFGTVLRAFDEKLQRVVAIKVMAPELAATSPARKRFIREAQASAQIRHENVVSVYSVEEKPIPYLVMEYIPGMTLQQRLDERGPLEVLTVLRLGRQIAEGLAAAHAKDLIHRDIKPGNILLETGVQDRVKITDFGLARAADDASMSQSGVIAGTPMYMAPEQALGHKLDQRADLFSFGSVLYQMVSGRPPFRASSTLAVLKRLTEETPRPIQEIIPETPAWLCDIIAKLHAKNPDERYQSAREIADVLANCESQLKEHSRLKDLSLIPRGKSPVRRSYVWQWIAAAVVLLPLIAWGAYGLTRPTAEPTDDRAQLAINWEDKSLVVMVYGDDGTPYVSEGATKGTGMMLKPGGYTVRAQRGGEIVFNQKVTLGPREQRGIDIPPLPETGWVQLFNGQDLTGWSYHSEMPGSWTVKDRLLTSGGPTSYLFSDRGDYANFHLRAVARVNPIGNSGIFFGATRKLLAQAGGSKKAEGREVQIAGGPRATAAPTGSLLQTIKSIDAKEHTPADEWFTLEIIAIGKSTLIKVNGKTAVDHIETDRIHAPGHIALQQLKPETLVQFKTIEIKELAATSIPPTYKNTLGMEFVIVPKGKSWLGGGKDKLGDKEVEIPADFYLGKYEVTQEEWEKVMGENPSFFSRMGPGNYRVNDIPDADLKRFPVENMTWDQCQIFVEKLNRLEKETGWVYRLPNDAEWEYACRGGAMSDKLDSAFDFYFAKPTNTLLPEQANFNRVLDRTCKVGSYEPNPLGLFDMHGNVWEWCGDTEKATDGASRPIERGGGWTTPPQRWRAAMRMTGPLGGSNGRSLRLARVPSGAPSPDAQTPLATDRFALAFDGEKSVVRIPSLKITEDHALTAEVWAVVEERVDHRKNFDILANSGSQQGFALGIPPAGYGKHGGEKWAFSTRLNSPDTYVQAWEKQPVPQNQLVHVAGIYDKGEIRFYVNGQLQSRTPAGDVKPSALSNMRLGANQQGQDCFHGRMNEVRISKVARYDTDFTPDQRWVPDTDTIALYHFDEGQGAVLKDSSGNGHHGEIVGAKWVTVDGSPIGSPRPATLEPLPPTYKNNIGMEFVIVPKGKSWLGGGKDKLGDKEVEIPADFYLGQYEVTQEEWEKVMGVDSLRFARVGPGKFVQVKGKNPSHFSRTGGGKDAVKDIPDAELKRFPVENVSWDECQAFVATLNKLQNETGWVYRLPKEAEWEYACRGGPLADKRDSAFDFYFAKPTNTLLPEQANIYGKGLKRTCKVGSYEANVLGLYDVYGNVREWCADTHQAPDASHRVNRGGGWDFGSVDCRTADRRSDPPSWVAANLGLRLARVPSGAPSAEAKTPLATDRFALAFDGKESRVKIPSLRITEAHPLTAEAWIVIEDQEDQHNYGDLLGNAHEHQGFAFIITQAGKLSFAIRSKSPDAYVHAREKQPVPLNQLIHVAGVYDGKEEIRLHVNGQLQSRTPIKDVKPSTLSTMRLGVDSVLTNFFRGRMNEVRISKVARYDADFTPDQRWVPDTNTLALYHFDEGEGAVLKDSSGNGHHGEIVGAKWVQADGSPIGSPPAIARFDAVEAKKVQQTWAGRFDALVKRTWSPDKIRNLKSQVDDGSKHHNATYRLLVLLAYEQDAAGHREYRTQHLRQFPKFEEWGLHNQESVEALAQRSLSAYLLLPVATEELASLSALAELVKHGPGSRAPGLRALGTLDYRAGRFADAARQFDASRQGYSQSTDRWAEPLSACAGFQLAMAHAQRGDVAAARAAYQLAGSVMTSAADRIEKEENIDLVIHDWMQAVVIWREAIDVLSRPEAKTPPVAMQAPLPPTFKNTIGMEFVVVPKGQSWLGGGKDKLGDKEVDIPANFYLGKYEVTQEEWEKVMGEHPSYFSRTGEGKDAVKDIPDAALKRFPVELVKWAQCQLFVAKLNKQEKETGWVYRLPTEVEWEYACRGGPMSVSHKLDSAFHFYFTKPTSNLLPEQANYNSGTEQNPIGLNRTCTVGSYEPNGLGLYDMHGNVWEWCDDTLPKNDGTSLGVYRGGSWKNSHLSCQASARISNSQSDFGSLLGFRLARVPSGDPSPEAKTPPVAAAPFTDADVQRIAALPAEQQVEEVRKELMKRNPGFDGEVGHKIEDGVLTEVKIVTDKVTDIAPIRVFNALRVLDCSGTHTTDWHGNGQLVDLTPLTGMNLAGLEVLRLHYTKVGDAGLASLKNCKNLISLALADTNVTDAGLEHFKECKGLTYLYFSDIRVGDVGLAHFQDCKDLKVLDLNHAKLTDAGLAYFKDCKALTSLSLYETSVSDSGLAHFKDCKALKHLNLTGTKVSDAGLASFKDMPLSVLWIDHTGITDLSPLQGMPLEEIRLTPKNITQGLDILRAMKSIKTIGIEYKQTWPAAEFWMRYDKGEFKE